MNFAIVRTGNKQYLVREGQTIRIEKVPVKEGEVLDLDVLLVADDDGKAVKAGAPTVSGAVVTARVISHGRAEKVSVVKYKPKVRYKRNVGHRQHFTAVKVEKIAA